MAVINLGNGNDLWEAFQQGFGGQPNTINAGGGNDIIISGGLNDTVNGEDGDDALFGVSGNDIINGGAGNDTLKGGNGSDTMTGGTGVDTYILDMANELGQDIISDDDGILKVGTTTFTIDPPSVTTTAYTLAGTPVLQSANLYTLTVLDLNNNPVVYNLEWSGVNGTDLVIWTDVFPKTTSSVTIQNFNDNTFGISFVAPNAAPVANNDSANVVEDSVTGVVINVLTNDTDSDGTLNPASVTVVTNALHGTTTINTTTGAITYIPTAGYVGSDTFTYTVLDNDGAVSNTATVTVNVTDSAIFLTNNADVWEPHSLGLNLVPNEVYGLDGNDVIVGGSVNDKLYGDGGNDLLYGNAGDDIIEGGEGDDVLDGKNGNNIEIGGNGNDTYVFEFSDAGTTTIIDNDGTLYIGNINFANGQFTGAPLAGTATQVSTGVYSMTIGANTYNLAWTGGNLVITQTNGSNPHVVTVNNYVNGTFGLNLVTSTPNAAPVANNDSANVVENSLTGVVIDVLANDSDSDGTINATTVAIIIPPVNGTASVNATTGAVTYIPANGYVGTDSFTYTVADDDGIISNIATVTLNVTDSAITLTNNVDFWEAFSQGLGFANNEIYALDGNDVIVSGNGNDIIDGGAGNDILFGVGGNDTINAGTGNDIIDAASGNNVATGGAGDDIYVVEFTDAGSTTINDDNGTIIIGTVNQQTFQPQGITLAGDAIQQPDGSYLLTIGADQFKLALTGGNLAITKIGGTNPHAVTINSFVSGTFGLNLIVPNVAPVASNDSATLAKNSNAVINVLANDTDSDGALNAASVAIAANPIHGTVNVNATTGAITYTPTADYFGTDSFTYTVLDNDGSVSNTATVNLTINDTPGVPVINLTNNNDNYTGSDSAENISGLAGNDNISGKGGNDTISGGVGNDCIDGDAGNDNISGDAGNDFIFGSMGNDTISGGVGNDFLSGGAGNDTISGDNGTDTIKGGKGDDILFGNLGNDFIFGNEGNDTINGGGGKDFLWGGAGNDIFVFDNISDSTQSSRDVIGDFFIGLDKISLSSLIADDFSDLIIQSVGGGVRVTDSDSAFSLIVDGVNSLQVSDFIFV